MRVLFVCTGNTCRSPMAQAIYNVLTNSSDAFSAGLFAQDGEDAAEYAKEAVKKYGASLEEHKAHTLTYEDIASSDIIITMTASHKKALTTLGFDDKTQTLCEFAGESGDVADPYGGSMEVYQQAANSIYELIKKGLDGVSVRFAKEEDGKIIADIEKNCFHDFWSEASILREIKNEKVLVAQKNSAIAGYCIFMQAADEGEILRIAATEEYRRQGIGKKLLEKATDILKENGAQTIFLEVRSKNTAAINLYKKRGFKEIDLRRGYYHDDDALIMKLER